MRGDLFTGDLLKRIKEVYLSPGEGTVKEGPLGGVELDRLFRLPLGMNPYLQFLIRVN
jgi:hypothetical protein